MSAALPNSAELQTRLQKPVDMLVACYCAGWCDTCALYRERFDGLAIRCPEHAFVWIDIEDFPDLLGDEDVENFPTLLIERDGDVLFFGTMLPHIEQLDRLIKTLMDDSTTKAQPSALPDVRALLAKSA